MSRAVIVVAAGSGERLGLGVPKALAPYRQSTVLATALRQLRALADSISVVVVAPPTHLVECAAIAEAEFAGSKHAVVTVSGGESRQESVRRGLAAVPASATAILVHDAARADAPAHLFAEVFGHIERTGRGAIPGLPVVDSIKRVNDNGELSIVDRDKLFVVQTPQGFSASILRQAYMDATAEFTDDAGLVSASGAPVDVIPGAVEAAKITFPSDLVLPEPATVLRAPVTGIGVDIHRFDDVGNAPLRMAGLEWPGEPALVGHSDGDVVLHAICDALLSAAHLGDLGTHFGSARPEFAGADSAVFVRETLRLLTESGYRPTSVAVQLVGERPRVAERRTEVEQFLTELVGVPVAFAATTTDKLGFLNVPDGLAAVATATIVERSAG